MVYRPNRVPLVDAAMRQFNATGWMHNRLRMVVASFLVKTCWWIGGKGGLLCPFSPRLWSGSQQWWMAMVRFYRVRCSALVQNFNPITQSTRFDPDGKFIRANVPELKNFSIKKFTFHLSAGKRPSLKQVAWSERIILSLLWIIRLNGSLLWTCTRTSKGIPLLTLKDLFPEWGGVGKSMINLAF